MILVKHYKRYVNIRTGLFIGKSIFPDNSYWYVDINGLKVRREITICNKYYL